MTADDFLKVRKWLLDHWPTLENQDFDWWVTLRDETARFTLPTVLDALRQHFDTGDLYPPPMSRLVRLCVEVTRDRRTELPALPGGRCVSWGEYAQERWGRPVTLAEAAMKEEP